MKYVSCALALLPLQAAADEIPTPRSFVQIPVPKIEKHHSKLTYTEACAESLRTGKPLMVGVGCSCPDTPGCICCEVASLEGFATGVHLATPHDGKLYHAGQIGGVTPTANYSELLNSSSGGGSCAGGSCGTAQPARGIFRRR